MTPKTDRLRDVRRPPGKDLGDERLVAFAKQQEMQVRGTQRLAVLGPQHVARGPVHRHGIARGADAGEMEATIRIRGKDTAQVHVGLLVVLIFVQPRGRRLPDVDARTGDRVARGIVDPSVHHQRRAGRFAAQQAGAVLQFRRVEAPERTQQRRRGFCRAAGPVVSSGTPGVETPRASGEESRLIVALVARLSDPVEEVESEFEFLFGGRPPPGTNACRWRLPRRDRISA